MIISWINTNLFSDRSLKTDDKFNSPLSCSNFLDFWKIRALPLQDLVNSLTSIFLGLGCCSLGSKRETIPPVPSVSTKFKTIT